MCTCVLCECLPPQHVCVCKCVCICKFVSVYMCIVEVRGSSSVMQVRMLIVRDINSEIFFHVSRGLVYTVIISVHTHTFSWMALSV